LLIAEVVVRVVRPEITYFFVPTSTNCLVRSETLAMRMAPNCSATSEGASFRTNAFGRRGPEVADDGAVRILAIGDSCTFG
jgi:hypothetical protein